MKYIKEYKVYEIYKEEVPYSKIDHLEYFKLVSNRVPFGLSEKKILVDHLFFYIKNVSEFQIRFIVREGDNVITYDIYKVNDEWFLVSEIYRHIALGPDKGTNWKCDQFDGLLEFLKFKNIIK
jgi:hypothetical protein